MIIDNDQNPDDQFEMLNRLPKDRAREAFGRSDYTFPIDIPDELRSWILGLIKEPALKSLVIRKTHKDFQTAGTSVEKEIFKLPANAEIISCWMYVPTAFAGTGITDYKMSIGPNGDEDGLQTSQDVDTTGIKKAAGTDFTTNRGIYSTTTSTTIEAKADTTGANLDQSTAGEVLIYLLYYLYPQNA